MFVVVLSLLVEVDQNRKDETAATAEITGTVAESAAEMEKTAEMAGTAEMAEIIGTVEIIGTAEIVETEAEVRHVVLHGIDPEDHRVVAIVIGDGIAHGLPRLVHIAKTTFNVVPLLHRSCKYHTNIGNIHEGKQCSTHITSYFFSGTRLTVK